MKKHNIPKSNSNTISKKKTPTTPPTRGSILSYKNDHKLNDIWNKIYSITNDCKTCSEHDKCTKSRIKKKIFKPYNPLR